jgi:hypothetical protein
MYDKSAVISSSSILLLLLLVDLINGYALPMATSPWHFNGSTLDFKQSKRVSHPGKRRCRSGLGAPHFTKPNNNSPWYGKTWASAVSYQSPVTQADPVLQIEAGCVYVAWPGVSEVFQWILETGESSAQSEHGKDMTWRLASKTNKGGIETALELPKYRVSHIRVIALDQKGAFLGTTSTVELDQVTISDNFVL